MPDAVSGGDINPLYPRKESIIPLARGNSWIFSHSSYDSVGNQVSSQEELNLAITDVYGLVGDTTLVKLTQYNVNDTFREYVYEYEWEATNLGLLISYRDVKVDTPGIYIRGTFDINDRVVFDPPILWLIYPLKNISTWHITDSTVTGGPPVTMEILSTDTLFYTAETVGSGMSAVPFYNCYLYRQTQEDSVSYYYYNNKIGSAGYLKYVNEVLRRSYILTQFIKN
jgi:hypothetical protein